MTASGNEPATIRHFIDGKYTGTAGDRLFDVFDPATGNIYARAHEAGWDEVDAAVQAARRALTGSWSRLSIEDRTILLHRVADGINARFEEFLQAECLDTGKPRSLARQVDIPRGAANFRIFADLIKNVPGESFMTATPDGRGALNYAIRAPKGVIAVICPWNLPFLLMTWKVGPALACGNTVVVKPSEETPATAALLGEVMNAAGVPAGVFNVVHGRGPGSAGQFLTQHTDISAITFTGETTTGTAIMQAAAVGIRDVSFELGGKNAGLVFADCDMEKAIAGSLRSVFSNCGQVCLGTERLYVERPIFNEFVERLRDGARKLKPGRPEATETDFGPMVSRQQRDKVLGYYKRAKAEGANIVTGGGIPDMPADLRDGFWIEPTLWTGLPESSAIVREEIFGPCCHIQPFDTEEEAIAMANDTRYGLAATIWTEDASRAHRVAAQMETGIIWVNCWYLRDLRTPFGGAKQSGIGREGGVHSLEFCTELRNVCVNL